MQLQLDILPPLNWEILLLKFRGCILKLGIGCWKIRGAKFLEGIQYEQLKKQLILERAHSASYNVLQQ